MDESSLTLVNPHYLQNVIKTAKKHEVVAGEDIYNSRGMKLIAKGERVDEKMQDRLIRFKLHHPLEHSLTVNEGITAQNIMESAEALLDEVGPLSALFKAKNSIKRAFSVLKQIHFDQVGTLLVTMESGIGTLQHSVLVSLSCLAFAIGLDLNPILLHELVLAGLLHDVGELYINPEYLKPDRILTPEEWKHIAIHPHIGQRLIGETTKWPGSIALAIGEHHERANGFGYPRHLTGDHLSMFGKILLVCEAICGVFMSKSHSALRACLAVKVIPGEYPPEIVSLLASIPDDAAPSTQDTFQVSREEKLMVRIERIEQMISAALMEIGDLLTKKKAKSSSAIFLDHVYRRLLMLRTVMNDTGLAPCYHIEHIEDHDGTGQIALEMGIVIYEIEWRLRELSRQITLMSVNFDDDIRNCLGRVITSLSCGWASDGVALDGSDGSLDGSDGSLDGSDGVGPH